LAAAALLILLMQSLGKTNRLEALWLPNASAFAAVLALVLPVLSPLLDRERQLPIRELAHLAQRHGRDQEPLLVVGYKRYSVVFYSGRPVLFVSSPEEALQTLTQHPHHKASLLLLGSDPELLDFGIGPGDATLVGRRDAHVLVRLPWKRLEELARRDH
jgi:hypothetical protein